MARSQRFSGGDSVRKRGGEVLAVDPVVSSWVAGEAVFTGMLSWLGGSALLAGNSGPAFLPRTLVGPATASGTQVAPFGKNVTRAWHSGPWIQESLFLQGPKAGTCRGFSLCWVEGLCAGAGTGQVPLGAAPSRPCSVQEQSQHFISSLCREKGALPQEVSQSGGSARTCAVSPGSIIYSIDYAETGREAIS